MTVGLALATQTTSCVNTRTIAFGIAVRSAQTPGAVGQAPYPLGTRYRIAKLTVRRVLDIAATDDRPISADESGAYATSSAQPSRRHIQHRRLAGNSSMGRMLYPALFVSVAVFKPDRRRKRTRESRLYHLVRILGRQEDLGQGVHVGCSR